MYFFMHLQQIGGPSVNTAVTRMFGRSAMHHEIVKEKIDTLVGQRIRQARIETQITGASLAAYAGISAQQLSKIERGQNRIHSGQLWVFAQALDRPVDWFFETPNATQPTHRMGRKTHDFFEVLAAVEPKNLQLLADMTRMLASGSPSAKKRQHPGSRREAMAHQADTLSVGPQTA